MLEFARRPTEDLKDIFTQTGAQRGIVAHIVEKDFWVCWLLRLIFDNAELGGHLVFKGGTSLSKVFGIIQRFSENIDLSVDPEWLGFRGAARPDPAGSRSKFNKQIKKLEDTCITVVVRPSYSGGISGVLDAFQKSKHLASVETISQMLNELEYVYPYHQAIGFYLDACGYDGATVLRKFGLNYKFYLGHQIRDPVLNEKWRVVFPKSLKVSIR